MKRLILALALFAGVIGVSGQASAHGFGGGGFHGGSGSHFGGGERRSDHRDFEHREFNRRSDFHRMSDRRDRRFSYRHNHRGYSTYRRGEQMFISID